MIVFKVNDIEVDYKTISYHARSSPKSEWRNYSLVISRDELELLSLIEHMLSAKTESDLFPTNAVKSGNDSSFNIVRFTIEWLDTKYKEASKDYNILWAFNTIDSVVVETGKIIVRGKVSEISKPEYGG